MKGIIKDAIRVGNSAGILLPKSWQGCKVKAILVEKPINIKQDILKILEPYLQKILSIYIVGSYARGEAREKSDIDILAITDGINKFICLGRYHITLVDLKIIKDQQNKELFYLLALIREAKALLNDSLLKELKKIKLSDKSLKWHLEMSKSALKIIKSFIKLDEIEENKILTSPCIIYSLILRIREAYIVDCLLRNRNYSTKELMGILTKKVSRAELEKIYESYNLVKDNREAKEKISLEMIKKLIRLLEEMLRRQEKWLKEKKD